MKPSEFPALFAKAEAAGREAGNKAAVVPMVVQDADLSGAPVPGSKQYFVADGVCGFASVNVKPANCGFAKWLVANGKARKNSYSGGVSFSIRDYNQSLTRKEEHAFAMAAVLRLAGIKAYADSRMD